MSERNRRGPSPSRRGEHAAHLYTLLLLLYPRAHRRAFGEQMLQTFRDHFQDAVETDGESVPLFWLGVLSDAGQSLARERVGAFRERVWTMKKVLAGIVVTGLLVVALLLTNLPARSSGQNPGVPLNDPIWRPVVAMAMLVLTLGLYAALVAAIVLVRTRRRSLGASARLGAPRITVWGILSFYAIMVNGVAVVVPDGGSSSNGFLVLTLPLLLTGVVGVIGSYASGSMRTGAFGGLLAGALYVLAIQLSWVLVLVVAWPAIAHHLVSSGAEGDFQRFVQATGRVTDLGTFLNFELFEDGIGFPIMASLIGLTLQGLCATLGGVLGASLKQAVTRSERSGTSLQATLPSMRPAAMHPALPTVRPIGPLLAALTLDLLVWMATVEFNALGGAHRLLGFGDLANSFVNQTFGLWLLGFLVVLAFVLVSARFTEQGQKAPGLPRGMHGS
jgi:hypothetical protein